MYQDFYLPQDYFEPEGEDWMPFSQMDHLKDFTSGLVQMLYSKDNLDLEHLEFVLGEICHSLNISLPSSDPTIERKSI